MISEMPRVWRDGLFAVCFGAWIGAAVLAAGCSSTSSLPPVESQSASTDSLAADPQVHEILATSCFDCHSNSGSGPWNAKLAPSYLFGAHKALRSAEFLELAHAQDKAARRDRLRNCICG